MMDWRILGHPTDGSAIRNFQSKNEMYESLLRAYSVDVSECSPQQYSEYVENIANVNEGGEANTFEFNDKKYAPSIFGVMVISGVWKQVEGVAYPVG